MEYGKWNLREFDQLSAEKEQEVLKYHEQHVRWAEKDSSLNNNQGIVLILDWDGFSLHHYSSVHGNLVPNINSTLKIACLRC